MILVGTWNTSIKGNDVTLDIYQAFFDRYNTGGDPQLISNEIVEEYQDYLSDSDDRYNALFGLALAQWETKCLNSEIYTHVKEIINKGDDLKLWNALGADAKTLEKREKVLEKFLDQLSTDRPKPKRRIKPKLEYSVNHLVEVESPDKLKVFTICEEFTNNNYIHTSGILEWKSGGGSGIVYFNGLGKKITAKWLNSNTIEITHGEDIDFTKKETKSYYCGDEVQINYKVMKLT